MFIELNEIYSIVFTMAIINIYHIMMMRSDRVWIVDICAVNRNNIVMVYWSFTFNMLVVVYLNFCLV